MWGLLLVVGLKLLAVNEKHNLCLFDPNRRYQHHAKRKVDQIGQSGTIKDRNRVKLDRGPSAVVIIWQLISELTLGCQELISALKPGCQIAHLYTVRKVGEIIRFQRLMKIMTRMRMSYTPRANRRSVSVVDQSTRACHLEMSLVLSIIHSLMLNGIISSFIS